ncbi:MAG TPA: hypothetical protein VNJ08_14515 [Bacteriovoracaceae bacterium]|nr:hypothetical protein [Bacteriovoracaceae bacterium]
MQKNFNFRFHMFIILLLTLIVGMVSNYWLLKIVPITNPGLRYPLTIIMSYLWFLFIMGQYIKYTVKNYGMDSLGEIQDDSPRKADTSSNFLDSFDVLHLFDGDGLFTLVLVFIFVLGSFVLLIWFAPEILAECLVQFLLVNGLQRRLKKIDAQEWLGHIFKVTIWPAVVVLMISLLLGLYIHSTCPGSHTLNVFRTTCLK